MIRDTSDYFIKVKNCFDINAEELLSLKSNLDWDYNHNGNIKKLQFTGRTWRFEYFTLNPKIYNYFTRDFCRITPDCIRLAEMDGESILPHIDNKVLTSLNYYLNSELDETWFFEKKNENVQGITIRNETEARIFREEDLDPIGHFVANSNESYLLNVNKIHTVKRNTKKTRVILKLHWFRVSYHEVLKNLL